MNKGWFVGKGLVSSERVNGHYLGVTIENIQMTKILRSLKSDTAWYIILLDSEHVTKQLGETCDVGKTLQYVTQRTKLFSGRAIV